MPAIAETDVFSALPADVRAAVLACAAVLERLDNEGQRIAVAVLMSAVRLGEIDVRRRPH
jgi:hypothetical protein